MFELRPGAVRFPARGMGFSLLLHASAFLALIALLPLINVPLVREIKPKRQELEFNNARLSFTLPALDSQTLSSPATRRNKPARRTDALASVGRTGLLFTGPQAIVSSPPQPDNFVQTVVQPDLAIRAKMNTLILSPNILQVSAPPAPLLVQPPVVELLAKTNHGNRIPVPAQPPEAAPVARLNLPLAGDLSSDTAARLVKAQTAAPMLAEQPPSAPSGTGPGSGTDSRNLLVLNAMPMQTPTLRIPEGELAGKFVVSSDLKAATSSGNVPGDARAAELPVGTTGGNPATGEKKSASDPGSGNAETGTTPAEGRPTAPGPPAHNSGERAATNGSGEAERGPFAGAGVSVATTPPESAVNSSPPRAAIPHVAYGMTIVATGSAGGGLKDYGIFKNEIVYTVYIEMSEPGHPRPSWTLQYASATSPSPAYSTMVPPFPIVREYPRLPREASARNLGRTLVVAGVITPEGKLDSLRVVQSPNPLLIQPLLNCLAQWTFQPAESNGKKVAARFALGIPLSADLMDGK